MKRESISPIRGAVFFLALITSSAGLVHGQTFTKITNGALVADPATALSVAWADYDGDGDLDVFTPNSGGVNNWLFRNDGGGVFTRIATGPVVESGGDSISGAWGDYDNDGRPDLFVANRGANHFLYRNLGAGVFSSVTSTAATTGGPQSYQGTWVDYDTDGFLDLLVVQVSHVPFLYRNNGNGTFSSITGTPITSENAAWNTGAWGDYNNDGLPDLFLTQSFGGADALYRNNGGGSFTKITSGPHVTDSGWGTSAAWGDYDNDGNLDLFVANRVGVNFLYHNNGNGTFTKITSGEIVTDSGDSNCAAWGDYDNDGWLDLYVANGDSPANQANYLYRNNGDGTFTRISSGDIVNDAVYSTSATWVDISSDGALDMFVANAFSNHSLYMNSAPAGNWLTFRLNGQYSNRSAIGAKVRVRAQIGNVERNLLRHVEGDGGFHGQNLELHFGLGNASIVNEVRVEWPSGLVQTINNVAINQRISINEGDVPVGLSFLPPAGMFTNSVQVTIQSPVGVGTIRYTTDGNDPTTASTAYTGPFALTETTTVKARLFVNGFPASEIAEAIYTRYVPPDIQFVPPGQLFTNQLNVTLVNNVGPSTTIRYTLNGSAPTSTSTAYTGPINLTATATIRAQVFLGNFFVSDVFTEDYARVYAFANDGVPFAWREQYFGPNFLTNPCAAADADCDGDSYTVVEEYEHGTDPTVMEIILSVRAVPRLTFSTIAGESYQIQRTTSLNPPDWEIIVTSILATGPELHYVDEEAPDNSYYRIEQVQD